MVVKTTYVCRKYIIVKLGDRYGCDHMGVGFTTTYAMSTYHGEVYSIQHYVVKFGCDLQQVDGFLWVLLKVALNPTNPNLLNSIVF